jgi:hypothetical protein
VKEPIGLRINADSLFRTARAAYLSSVAHAEAPFSPPYGGSYPLVAVVFAAASLEGFINELAALAPQHQSETMPPIGQFATLAAEADAGRASTKLKFQLAFLVFDGQPLDHGRQPYQDFDLLFAVRNEIIHLKEDPIYPTVPGGEPTLPKIARRLDSRRVKLNLPKTVNPLTGDYIDGSFVSLLSTPEVAKWACETAANMVQAVCAVIPRSDEWPSLSQVGTALHRDVCR